MSDGRKKPIKLSFETRLVDTHAETESPVKVRGSHSSGGEKNSPKHHESAPQPLTGGVKMRREVKGRNGKPVTVLFDFTSPHANHAPSLRALQSKLKESLACGGTFDESSAEIVLQVDELPRVRSVLEKLGFSVKG